jgi:hypothetical protein
MSYIVHTIDAERLAQSPESDTIVRLMWALNDMNQLTHLGKLIHAEHQTMPELWKYRDSVVASLTRQRSARISEILDCIVRPLVADNAKECHPHIHEVIEAEPELQPVRASLRDLFYQSKEEFERHRSIRNRITDHFDHKRDFAIIPESLKLTADQTQSDENGVKRGWLFYGMHEQNRDIMRFLIADDVLNTGWREVILQIPYQKDGYADSDAVKQSREFTLPFMELFHKFGSKLIDAYLTHHSLWLPKCNPTDLLYPIDIVPRSLPLQILAGENHAVAEVADLLGPTKNLVDDAATLYESLIHLIVNGNSFGTTFDINQRTSVFHCLQSLRYSLVVSVSTMYRGHVTDTSNYSRRSIEVAAFLVEICLSTESAKRWMEMGKSNTARKKYKSSFQAHQLVVNHEQVLTRPVVDLYDNFCLFVHPSYASMHHQIKVAGNEHQFHYFEHQTEAQKANLIMQLFIILNTHMRLMNVLLSFFVDKNIGIDCEGWLNSHKSLAEKIEEAKKQWLPLVKKFGLECE